MVVVHNAFYKRIEELIAQCHTNIFPYGFEKLRFAIFMVFSLKRIGQFAIFIDVLLSVFNFNALA